ncbi:hypothetical protein STA1M1_29930 [Sinisalibacter aestuarii]|uniref:Uncharacterized protein n=1 Tax=Sinisalibacter aestuarii TaxID=2949426 RepID=A0ABQ5LW43_9RHOB|nr:hypothetical protein STA1M1_29930 [Sinisalibacter aestuarii]
MGGRRQVQATVPLRSDKDGGRDGKGAAVTASFHPVTARSSIPVPGFGPVALGIGAQRLHILDFSEILAHLHALFLEL